VAFNKKSRSTAAGVELLQLQGGRMQFDPIMLGWAVAMIINYWLWSRDKK
jgi:hypothetical protein